MQRRQDHGGSSKEQRLVPEEVNLRSKQLGVEVLIHELVVESASVAGGGGTLDASSSGAVTGK